MQYHITVLFIFLFLQTMASTLLTVNRKKHKLCQNCTYSRTTEWYSKCFCYFLHILYLFLNAGCNTELGIVFTIDNAHSYTATSGTHG